MLIGWPIKLKIAAIKYTILAPEEHEICKEYFYWSKVAYLSKVEQLHIHCHSKLGTKLLICAVSGVPPAFGPSPGGSLPGGSGG